MSDEKAICVNQWITARGQSGKVLLFSPGYVTEAGHYIQANEVFLTREEIAELAREFPVKGGK